MLPLLNYHPPSLIFEHSPVPTARTLTLWNSGSVLIYYRITVPNATTFHVANTSGILHPAKGSATESKASVVTIEVTKTPPKSNEPAKRESDPMLLIDWMITVSATVFPSKEQIDSTGVTLGVPLELLAVTGDKSYVTWKDPSKWTPITHLSSTRAFIKPDTVAAVSNGGYGAVWKGQLKVGDSEETLAVAIKEIRLSGENQTSGTTLNVTHRAVKELKSWGVVDHPNIAKLLGTFVETNICFVSPWYAKGGVFAYVQEENPSNEERLRMVRELAGALLYLHKKSLVHGDIKHDNVLLDEVNTPNGIIIRPILNDLGLSATVDGIEATAVITSSIRDRGQPAYMAPELQFWSSDKPPPRWIYSDIYSFGLLALEIYSGVLAFPKEFLKTPSLVAVALHDGRHVPVPRRFPTIATEGRFWRLMTRCLNKSPKERPVTQALESEIRKLVPKDVFI